MTDSTARISGIILAYSEERVNTLSNENRFAGFSFEQTCTLLRA